MIKEIVTDPIFLSQKLEPATKNDQQIIRDLLDTISVNAEHCVGMAANMIGVWKTILVAKVGKEYLIMVNPKIVDYFKQCYNVEEGCLSLSGHRMIKRYPIIVVEYLDKKSTRKSRHLKTLKCRSFSMRWIVLREF